MAMRGVMTVRNGPAQQLKRLREANKEAIGEAGLDWHKRFLPIHFTTEANERYGYQPRRGDNEPQWKTYTDKKGRTRKRLNQAYSWRKRHRRKHNKPLVFTGRSEHAAKRAVKITVKRSAKQHTVTCVVVMPQLPKYFYQYRKDLNTPDKYNELTRSTKGEAGLLALVHDAAVKRIMASGPEETTKTIAG